MQLCTTAVIKRPSEWQRAPTLSFKKSSARVKGGTSVSLSGPSKQASNPVPSHVQTDLKRAQRQYQTPSHSPCTQSFGTHRSAPSARRADKTCLTSSPRFNLLHVASPRVTPDPPSSHAASPERSSSHAASAQPPLTPSHASPHAVSRHIQSRAGRLRRRDSG